MHCGSIAFWSTEAVAREQIDLFVSLTCRAEWSRSITNNNNEKIMYVSIGPKMFGEGFRVICMYRCVKFSEL